MPPPVPEKTAAITLAINTSFEEVERRLGWIKQRHIQADDSSEFRFHFQEYPEKFQMWLIKHFKCDWIVCNTSEQTSWAVGAHNEFNKYMGARQAAPAINAEFLEVLFDRDPNGD